MVNTAFKLTTNAFMLIEYINRSYLSRADDNQDSSMNNKYFWGGGGGWLLTVGPVEVSKCCFLNLPVYLGSELDLWGGWRNEWGL